jgi:hypothetical protein
MGNESMASADSHSPSWATVENGTGLFSKATAKVLDRFRDRWNEYDVSLHRSKPMSQQHQHPPRYTSAVTAYYHISPIWVGETPSDRELQHPQRAHLAKDVYQQEFTSGIRVRVRRDGLFVFDFSVWEPGSPVQIPGWSSAPGEKIPQHVLEAEAVAEAHLYQCIEAMNAHLACLNSAYGFCQHAALPIIQIITPSDYLSMRELQDDRLLSELRPFWCPTHTYIERYANFYMNGALRRSLHTFHMETVQKSFELFDQVIASNDADILKIVNLLYRSARYYSDHDFSNALILSWSACEKLLCMLWDDFLNSKNDQYGGKEKFINRERRDKLTGRDFTASIVTEMLSLSHELSFELYKDLNEIRQARNRWIHTLHQTSAEEAILSLRTAQRFLERVRGIKLGITISRSSQY